MRIKLLTPVFVLSVIITVMFISTLVVTQKQKDDGLVINLAGRQRMLSQKMTKEILYYHASRNHAGTDMTSVKADLESSMNVFDKTLNALIDSGPAPMDLKMKAFRNCPSATEPAKSQLGLVKNKWNDYASKLRAVLANPGASDAEIVWIVANNMGFMAEMDKAVVLLQKQSEKKVTLLVTLQMAGVVVATIFVVLFVMMTIRMSASFNGIIAALGSASDQVSESSSAMASSSQFLADGATRQAASIEETSSALEEMSGMTRQNAVNSDKANTMMKETNTEAENANRSMNQLVSSMTDIFKASEETSRIIKTIDEIAFQTNLLALNAAVEAARAGEVGAGFAVVANEVRNLAVRAAEAARNTTALIEDTISKVSAGVSMVDGANATFKKVIDSGLNVGVLIQEIASASSEQAQGIAQINQAIADMDTVVQKTAAISEEAASSSEETNAQAIELTHIVHDLIDIVEGPEKAAMYAARSGKGVHGRQTHPGQKRLAITLGAGGHQKS